MLEAGPLWPWRGVFMITGYFGAPGVGKTTILTMIAQQELLRMKKGKSPYEHVLTNFYCDGCEKIKFNDLGVFDIERCLILLDEITLDADSRDFKHFAAAKKLFFTLHRHVGCDIVYFCQDYSRVDKSIRELTLDLWYVTKSVVPILRDFTKCTRIFRNININEFTSELTMGYRFPSFSERLFVSTIKVVWRRRWYKFFDSFDKTGLDTLDQFTFVGWKAYSEEEHLLPDESAPAPSRPVVVKVKRKAS